MKNLQKVIQFLTAYDVYLILGHTEPDGDCVGSQLSLASAFTRTGKKALALQTGPFDRPETLHLDSEFLKMPPALEKEKKAVIVCDCSTPDRIAKEYHELLSLPTLIIDHHASGDIFGNVRCVDSSAASTTILVAEILEAMQIDLTPVEAERLLFGLATDTGYFRHCEKNSSMAFFAAAKLIEAGASPKAAYYEMYGNREFLHRKYLGLLLDRAQSHYDGKLIYTYQKKGDEKYTEVGGRSTDELYGLFQTVKNVEVILFVKEESSGGCSVGLRSKQDIDVGKIAQKNGGGGHKLAAGFNFSGNREEVQKLLLETFAPLFQG